MPCPFMGLRRSSHRGEFQAERSRMGRIFSEWSSDLIQGRSVDEDLGEGGGANGD